MTIAVALLAYALGVGTIGSVLLGRAAWPQRAPMLGILTYLAAAWSSVAALGLAGLTLAVHATALGSQLSILIGACVLRLRAEYDAPGGALVAFTGLAVAFVLLARTAATAAVHLRAVRQHALQHAQTARLVGHPEPGLGAILVEHDQPASYCVAGPHPTVVLTTGAVQALHPAELTAVLAHERAHLAYHHHRLLAVARIGHQVLPFLPIMREAATQIALLVEMHADDVAARTTGTRSLAAALVVLAASAPPAGDPAPALVPAGPAQPAVGLAAATTDAVQRIGRLLYPAEPLSRFRRQFLRAGAATLALTPVVLALTPALVALALGRVPGS